MKLRLRSATSVKEDHLSELPVELVLEILNFCSVFDVLHQLFTVSRHFFHLINALRVDKVIAGTIPFLAPYTRFMSDAYALRLLRLASSNCNDRPETFLYIDKIMQEERREMERFARGVRFCEKNETGFDSDNVFQEHDKNANT